MLNWNHAFSKKQLVCYAVLGAMFSLNAYAQNFSLEKGATQLVQTKEKIDTIFVSSPNVADYEILDDNTFIIYAKDEGKAEVTAFGADGRPLTSDTVNVDSVVTNIADTNKQLLPQLLRIVKDSYEKETVYSLNINEPLHRVKVRVHKARREEI